MNLFLFNIIISSTIFTFSWAIRDLLEQYVTFENFKKERDLVYKTVYNYRQLDKKNRQKILDDLHHKYHAHSLALILHNVGMLRPASLRERVEMIPNAFFNERQNDYFEEDVDLKPEYRVDKKFGKFLDELEKKYDHDKAHDEYYEKHIFSPEGIRRKIDMMLYLQDHNKTHYLHEPLKAKSDEEFKNLFGSKKERPPMEHLSKEDKEKFEKYLSAYYARIFRVYKDRVHHKTVEHHVHHEYGKRAHKPKPRPHKEHFKANLTKLKDDLPKMEEENKRDMEMLLNHTKKTSFHHHRKMVSFLQLQSKSGLYLASKTETLSQTIESMGQCPIPMPPPKLDEEISQAKSNAELSVKDVMGDDASNDTLIIAIIKMIVFLIIAIIKMIIQIVVSIIAGFLRQCFPPGPLTIFSCPEGAFWLENLYHPVQFDEKTFALWKKAIGFPFYFSDLLWNQLKKRYTIVSYYICGQGFFTLDCSVLWPRCFEFSYLVTNPPILGNPFLVVLTILDWLVLIPGDCPFCFLNCIQVLLQCDIPWEKISTCYGIYNMELPLAMAKDPSLAIYVGLSMAPPFCTYNPFILLLWILKPPPEIPDEFFPKEIPSLSGYQKAVSKAIKGECAENEKKSGLAPDEDEEQKQGEEKKDQEESKEEQQQGQGQGQGQGIPSIPSGSYSGSGDIPPRTTHPRMISKWSHPYHVINWEKYLTDPDTVRTNQYLSSLNIGQGENNLSAEDISRITREAESLATRIWNEKKANGPFVVDLENFKRGIVYEQLQAAKTLSEAHPTQPTRIPLSQPFVNPWEPTGSAPSDNEKELNAVQAQGPNRYIKPDLGKETQTVSGEFGDQGLEYSK